MEFRKAQNSVSCSLFTLLAREFDETGHEELEFHIFLG